uniref:CEP170 C-terminal domain-containing protein n=1 Tax=Mastacembelus armatus TaxID=205130 RepID=A0A3Q3LUB2_9TELE
MGSLLLLASVTQLSTRIRQSVDRTACKIRILFKDKERKWEDIENKLQAEHDSLLLKSSNKEISTIIQDLKRVERQLLVIDMMVDPDGTLDALSSLGLTSPLTDQKISPGAQQGVSVLHPGAEASSSMPTAPRPEGPASKPCVSSDQTEVEEHTQQSSRAYTLRE